MADDAQITEEYHYLNGKRTSSFSYANRYDTKEKIFEKIFMFSSRRY